MLAYELVAARLLASGVDTVFGVMGDGNMHWVAAYARLPGAAYVPAWHEAGAVGMADGWAAARGDGAVGVATVTMGPGLAQALGALTAAARTRRPLLLVTAEAPDTQPPQAQWADQEAWVRACGADYVRVGSTDAIVPALDDALARAAVGTPVVLAFALDVFEQDVAQASAARGGAAERPDAAGSTRPAEAVVGDVAAAAELLSSAATPLVVLGRGAASPAALAAARDLAVRIGAAVATTVPAKGAGAGGGDALVDLGLTGMMAGTPTRARFAEADVVLVVGAALDRYNTDGGGLLATAHVVRADRRPAADMWDPAARSTVHLTGDAAAVLPALVAALPSRTSDPVAPPVADQADQARHLAQLATREIADGPNPWAVVTALDAGLPQDAYVVVGIGHFWYFVTPYLSGAGVGGSSSGWVSP